VNRARVASKSKNPERIPAAFDHHPVSCLRRQELICLLVEEATILYLYSKERDKERTIFKVPCNPPSVLAVTTYSRREEKKQLQDSLSCP